MSSLSAVVREEISSQDEALARVRDLLGLVAEEIDHLEPDLGGLYEHRPSLERNSGVSWRGIETVCHVSALLSSHREAPLGEDRRRRLFRGFDRSDATRSLHRHEDHLDSPLPRRIWTTPEGDRLEIASGVRLTVRAISAPYLPGSLSRSVSTSPVTPPPRRIR